MAILARHEFQIQDNAGNVLPSASVTVTREGGGLEALYSDRAGASPISNPFTATPEGVAAFHCLGGAFKIDVTLGAFTRTMRYVAIGTAGETDAGFLAVPNPAQFLFDNATADADPGNGEFRLNNADPSLATQVFVDNVFFGGASSTPWLDLFDDFGDSSLRGFLTIFDLVQPTTIFRRYKVTGTVVDGTGYRKITLEHITGVGSFVNAAPYLFTFDPRGPTGNTIDASSSFQLSGDITPAQITVDQNDYNPTGLSTASVLRLSSDAQRNITGIQGGADGRILFLYNVGSQNIVLQGESGSSSAANRFAVYTDLNGHRTLKPNEIITIQYDNTAQRWRIGHTLQLDHINRFLAAQGFNQATLTDAATITWNGDTQQVATVTLGANRILGAISNPRAGFTYILRVVQDATGGRTLDLTNAIYKFPNGPEPVLSTAPGAVDVLTFVYDGVNMLGSIQKDFTTSFPAVEATNVGTSTAATSFAVPLPASIVAGELLLVFVSLQNATGATVVNTPSGWTQLYSTVGGGNLRRAACFYKIASGSEGATVTITCDVSSSWATNSYRISKAFNGAPFAGTSATGNSNVPNPPSNTPSPGSRKYLWIAVEHDITANTTAPTLPTNYTTSVRAQQGTVVQTASGRRSFIAASEDPATFTIGAAADWVAQTVAVRPA